MSDATDRLEESRNQWLFCKDLLDTAREKQRAYRAESQAITAEIDRLRDQHRWEIEGAVASGKPLPESPVVGPLVLRRDTCDMAVSLAEPDIIDAQKALQRADELVKQAELGVAIEESETATAALRAFAPGYLNTCLKARRLLQGHALNDHLKVLHEVFPVGDHDLFAEYSQ